MTTPAMTMMAGTRRFIIVDPAVSRRLIGSAAGPSILRTVGAGWACVDADGADAAGVGVGAGCGVADVVEVVEVVEVGDAAVAAGC